MSLGNNLMQGNPTTKGGSVNNPNSPGFLASLGLGQSPGSGQIASGAQAVAKAVVPKPLSGLNDPRFQTAAANGMFGPTNLQQLLQSPEYQAAGNNNQAYDQAYQNAIAAQRSNITQMYGAAFQDIANRQAAGDQAIGALPGQINAAYAPAEAAVTQSAQAAEAGQKASGLATFMPSSAISQPEIAAEETSKAAHVADVPILHQAINNELGQERSKVSQAQSGALADLAKQEADHAQQSQEPSWMQKLLIDNFQQQQQAKASGDQKTQQALAKTQQGLQALTAKTANVGPNSGKLFSSSPLVANQVLAIKNGQDKRGSAAYYEAQQQLGQQMLQDQHDQQAAKAAGKSAPPPKAMAQKYANLIKKYPKQGVAISMALNDMGMPQSAWQQIMLYGQPKPKKK